MEKNNLWLIFQNEYTAARESIKSNSPGAALAHLHNCKKHAADLYVSVGDEKYFSLQKRMLDAIETLSNYGINKVLLDMFNIDPRVVASKVQVAANVPKEPIKANNTGGKQTPIADWKAAVYEENCKSVVCVRSSSGKYISSGTGFIISEKGYLLTNHHVVFDEFSNKISSNLSIKLFNSNKYIPITCIDADESKDVALCKFDTALTGKVRPVQRIKDYSTVKVGSEILVVGNGLSFGIAPTEGVIKFPCNSSGNLMYTAGTNKGDSGGPVFLSNGLCIGINKSVVCNAHNMANGTPMDQIDQLLEKWCKKYKISL